MRKLHYHSCRIVGFCLAIAITAVFSSQAGAEITVTKLNGPLVAHGEVLAYFVSPDGNYVVYVADQDTDNVTELYSVPIGGGTSVKLNGPIIAGGNVQYYYGHVAISADSSWVVYVADQETDEVFELYSVPISGGPAVKLNGTLVAGGDVMYNIFSDFAISPDSARVVYRADQDTNDMYELYSVPIEGGPAVKLNGLIDPGGFVGQGFHISMDSNRVVFKVDPKGSYVHELYSVPIEGGPAVRIDGTDVPDGNTTFQITADSSRVVYRTDRNRDRAFQLYSVPIAGGMSVKLNGHLTSGGIVSDYYLAMDPASSRVVYRADQDTNDVRELYSVAVGGGTPVKLNGPLVSGGDVAYYCVISPDSRWVVYAADQDKDEVIELYSVPIGGGTPVKLNGSIVFGGDVSYDAEGWRFAVSGDSTRVVYHADQDTDEIFELYSAPISGGRAVKLNGSLVPGAGVGIFAIIADSSRVVYRSDQGTDGVWELYSVPIAGGTPVKLNRPFGLDADVGHFSFGADPHYVVYNADEEVDGVSELYSSYDDSPPSAFPRANVKSSWETYR